MDNFKPVSVLVRNERGVLARVAGLFARRGFNITSLAVGEVEDPSLSRMSIVVEGDDATVEQLIKQLCRLVAVVEVCDLSRTERVERGMALIKVAATPDDRHRIMELASIFRARINNVDAESMVVEVTGNREKVQAFIEVMRPHGILEMARTGQIALSRHGSMASQSERGQGVELLSLQNHDSVEAAASQQ